MQHIQGSSISHTIIEFFNSTPTIGVYACQETGKFVFVNNAFCNFTGYTREELLNKINLQDIVEGAGKEKIANTMKKLSKCEEVPQEPEELLYRTKHGFLKPALSSVHLVTYDNKSVALVILVDTIKQKTYETLYRSLSEINHIITNTTDEAELLESICESLYKVAGFDPVCIGIVDEKTKLFNPIYIAGEDKKVEHLKKTIISVDENIKEGRGSVGRAFREKRIAAINNIYQDKGMSAWRNSQNKFGLYSVCSIPLFRKGKIAYILLMYSQIPGIFSQEYYSLLENIQLDISSALETTEIQKWNYILTEAVNSGFDFVIITDKSMKIVYVNEHASKLLGYPREKLLGESLTSLLPNIQAEKTESWISGEIYITPRSTQPNKSNSEPIKLLVNITPIKVKDKVSYYIATGKNITENKELTSTMEEILTKDHLTKLVNRNTFSEMVQKFIDRAKHQNVMGAVAVINPIRFSAINEAFGFDIGNKILIEISKRLKSSLREYDLVARLESEKFAVLLEDIKREEDIFVILMDLLRVLSEPYTINKNAIHLSFNAGVAIYPQDAQEPEKLIEKAQIALLDARTRGKSTLGFYKEKFRKEAEKRVRLEGDVINGIKNNEFKLYFQPYFNAKNNQVYGAEVLIRWNKQGTLVQPSEFIPLLEETHLITLLEKWISEKTLEKMKIWEKRYGRTLPLSVNISPTSLNNAEFIYDMLSKIEEIGINPSQFTVEITERSFLGNLERVSNILHSFKLKNVKISIDDFGTGFSSLSYLTRLPVDHIKIDISFVSNLTTEEKTRAITKAIIYLAKELNMKTIAEGVETKEQLMLLKEFGCDCIQGFIFSKPLPEEHFEEKFLRKR